MGVAGGASNFSDLCGRNASALRTSAVFHDFGHWKGRTFFDSLKPILIARFRKRPPMLKSPVKSRVHRNVSGHSKKNTHRAKTKAKWVHLFSEGDAHMRDLLGGKGANLAEMTRIGLPVPPRLIVTTQACNAS